MKHELPLMFHEFYEVQNRHVHILSSSVIKQKANLRKNKKTKSQFEKYLLVHKINFGILRGNLPKQHHGAFD